MVTELGSIVSLDGTESYDANKDPLTCLWQIVSLPAGSGAEIADPTAEQTSFVADLAGTYVVSLIVPRPRKPLRGLTVWDQITNEEAEARAEKIEKQKGWNAAAGN